MEQRNSLQYYRDRERKARELAMAASSPAIGRIHLEMADRYAVITDELMRTSILKTSCE